MIIDIVLLAILSAIIFYKLNNEFGKIDEKEKENIKSKIKNQQLNPNSESSNAQDYKETNAETSQDVKLVGQGSTDKDHIFSHESIAKLPYIQKRQIINIFEELNIDLDFFLSASKATFQMIIKSFSDSDMEDIRHLCSETVFTNLKHAKQERINQNKILVSKIIEIDTVEIVLVNQTGNEIKVSLQFTSKQINFITNLNNEIIKGSADKAEQVLDKWTFSYDIAKKSIDNTWYLVSTH
jgi:predicted lipid-binding transport protein (Tim44 family)